MDNLLPTGIIVSIIFGIVGANNFTGCQSPQYLQKGTQGTISCPFQNNFFSVYWYDTKQYVAADAIIEYQGSIKRGEGYETGMFDVHENGSLVINNVSLEHDHFFTAVELRSVGDYHRHYVRVIVTVKPAIPYPVIENCGQVSTLCYVQLHRGTELSCYVGDARPAVALNWVTRTVNGDRNLSSVLQTNSSGLLNSSTSTIHDQLAYTSGLKLFVCKAHSLPGVLSNNESLAVVETYITDLTYVKPVSKYVKMNSKVLLTCLQDNKTFFVWKHKLKAENDFTAIAYGTHGYNNVSTFQSNGYRLTNNGSLIIPELLPEHEGFYACIVGNGTSETIFKYEMTAYIPPDPAYPMVEGCILDQYCVLRVNRTGILTCSVKGIRPKVDLIWKTVLDISSHEIPLHVQTNSITSNDDGTFDVVLTTHFDASRSSMANIPMECKISGLKTESFPLSTQLDLLFVQEGVSTTASNESREKAWDQWWIIFLLVFIIFFIAVFLLIAGKYLKTGWPQCEDGNHDNNLTLSLDSTHKDKALSVKEEFIEQLKTKYADLTATVYPVPYLRDTMYSVNDVFVGSGFEFLLKRKKWETLQAYHQIFRDPRLDSRRRIIEGDPGYGKSMLTLQFAYDWCEKVQESPLATKDIFILLQLRQLEGVKSITEAIKACLLPKDTKLSKSDIETILQESKSVLVVLDGYDEYPHKGDENTSFVEDIMKGDILQDFEFILTTRTACLPNNCSPQTKKIRMQGFDDKAREAYLQKVLAGEDHDPIQRIQENLHKNPFLEDLCHIPLFFVLFSHLSSEPVLKFNSVTVFFRHIISCLHSHMKNKARNPTEEMKLEPYEKDHRKLDEVAFEGLSGKMQSLVWKKESICRQVGKDFYNHYVSMGVLLEEKIQFIDDAPGTYSPEHICYRHEVRFYHKLFCEWYAAHVLADYAANPAVSLDPRDNDEESRSLKHEDDSLLKDRNQEERKPIIQNLDPADVQYVYRFACGLNAAAAEEIFQYLTTTPGGDKFAILCLLEQSGKFEELKPMIKTSCATAVTFRHEHSKLLQRSTAQLLEIASSLEIPIANLQLHDCFLEVRESSRSIKLTSDVNINRMNTLLSLEITVNDKEITEEEMMDIINFCIQCRELKSMKFRNCLMPGSIHIEKSNAFQKKPITVEWDTGLGSCFTFNPENGSWQHANDGRSLTGDEYEQERRRYKHLEG